jgi:predicted DsbA family dithiol-disulfide isomerase
MGMQAEYADAISRERVNGVPFFIIRGEKTIRLSGGLPVEEFERAISDALGR